jgi:hypothetical protein
VADNIITPEFRAGFSSVFRAIAQKQADGSMGKAKYSVRAAFPPTSNLAALKAEAEKAAKDRWGDKIPKQIRGPFRANKDLENPLPGIGDDWIIMTFSANEDRRPGLVDGNRQDIIDEAQVYSGAWFRAQVRAFAYDNAGNKGVAFGLQNLQKLRDDESLGGGRVPASKAFDAVPGAAQTAGSLFDAVPGAAQTAGSLFD